MLGGKKSSKQIFLKVSVINSVYIYVYIERSRKECSLKLMLFIPLANIIGCHVPGIVLGVEFTNVINERHTSLEKTF